MNVSLAAIALAEKRYADGVSLARQAITGYEKSNSAGNLAWSQAVLARNLLGIGGLKEAEAEAAAAKAVTLSRSIAGQTPRYEAALADAFVKAKSGKTAEARTALNTAFSSAHKYGYRLYELQIRLARGEIDLAAGSTSARANLTALEKDARTHGASLVADQARALLTDPPKTR